LKKPAAVSLKKGDTVTVEVKDRAAFQEGTQATFYTEGWIFGSGVAVKELGHAAPPSGPTPGPVETPEKTVVQSSSDVSDQDLPAPHSRSGLCGHRTPSPMCIPGPSPKSAVPRYRTSEHSASWHEAVLQVQSVLKGPKLKRNKSSSAFRSPATWPGSSAPKFEPGQQGVFILAEGGRFRRRRKRPAPPKADVYTCLRPGDFVPLTEEPRVRSLLKKIDPQSIAASRL